MTDKNSIAPDAEPVAPNEAYVKGYKRGWKDCRLMAAQDAAPLPAKDAAGEAMEPDSDAEWELEQRAFHAANQASTLPEYVRTLIKDMWHEIVSREARRERNLVLLFRAREMLASVSGKAAMQLYSDIDDVLASSPSKDAQRCAECDCEKGGVDCNWIKAKDAQAVAKEGET